MKKRLLKINKGVFLITTIFPPDVGGPATYVRALGTTLHARGWRVAVATFTRYPVACPFPVALICFSFPLNSILLFFSLIRKGRAYGIWYAHGGISATVPALCAARLLGVRCGIKVTGDYAWETARNREWTADGIDDFQNGPRGFRCRPLAFMRAWAARHADFVVVPSRYLGAMVAGWGAERDRIAVIPNAVPVPELTVFARDPFLFFSAGRFVSWKNFDMLMRSFAECVALEPRARLVIAGDGPQAADLRSQAAVLRIADTVTFAGTLSKEEMARLYARAGCFVLCSEYEGMPHVLLEARAYGMPIITTDAGGITETVRDGVDAAVVRCGDERGLADAMGRFLKNPDSIPRATPSSADQYPFELHSTLTERAITGQ